MKAIYKRELKSYFHSMIGYVFITFLVVFTGIYFVAYNLNYGYPYFSYVLSGITYVFLAAVPLLTMKSFAEEQKSKTDQMLLTAPVDISQIVVGKYLAMVTILAVPCVIFLIFPLIIKAQGTAYVAVDYLAILMFFLLGCVYLAIGMFVSSLTQSQIIAAIGTFGVLMITYLWSGLLDFLPTTASANAIAVACIISVFVFFVWRMTANWILGATIEAISIIVIVVIYIMKSEIFENLITEVLGKADLINIFGNITSNQIFDISGAVLYLTLIALFDFLTVQMIQKRRWS